MGPSAGENHGNDPENVYSQEATLLRLQDTSMGPLGSLQIEVARISGYLTATLKNHEQQIKDTKTAAENASKEAHDALNMVNILKVQVDSIQSRLNDNKTTVLQILGPVVSVLSILVVVFLDISKK